MTNHRPPDGLPLERLESGLRRLPPPPVPAGLKDRLLAAIPERSAARPAWRRVGAAVALAAACGLLALLLRGDKPPLAPAPKVGGVARTGPPRQAPPLRAHPLLTDGAGSGAPFRWPLPTPAAVALSSRLPDDLLQ